MKATELMLNDFLYYKNHGEVVRVSEIIGGIGECVRVTFNKKNNIRSNTPAVLGCNLHPIEITEEWLKLNGFTKVSHRYQRDIDKVSIRISEDFTGICILEDEYPVLNCISLGTKLFVHILQHYTNKYIYWIMPKMEKRK